MFNIFEYCDIFWRIFNNFFKNVLNSDLIVNIINECITFTSFTQYFGIIQFLVWFKNFFDCWTHIIFKRSVVLYILNKMKKVLTVIVAHSPKSWNCMLWEVFPVSCAIVPRIRHQLHTVQPGVGTDGYGLCRQGHSRGKKG